MVALRVGLTVAPMVALIIGEIIVSRTEKSRSVELAVAPAVVSARVVVLSCPWQHSWFPRW